MWPPSAIPTVGRMTTAIVTGASQGLGRALATELADRGWALVLDARGGDALEAVRRDLAARTEVVAVRGDVASERHRRALVTAAGTLGGADLLVNNASTLGASPLPALAVLPLDTFRRVYEVNVVAPLRLVQLALPQLVAHDGTVVNVTSDAGVEAYPGWGGYGSAKAALDHVSAVLAVEHPGLRVYALDPGDMRTAMHQDAYPGEDISDRPPPEASVPGVLRLLEARPASGRYLAREVARTWSA